MKLEKIYRNNINRNNNSRMYMNNHRNNNSRLDIYNNRNFVRNNNNNRQINNRMNINRNYNNRNYNNRNNINNRFNNYRNNYNSNNNQHSAFILRINNRNNLQGNHEIKDFPEIVIEDVSKLEESNRRCVICFEDFNSGEKVTALPCIHFFHNPCIKEWIKKKSNCPICKFELTEENLNNKMKENI